MSKREIVKAVLDGKQPPYVPWDFSFTGEAMDKLVEHFDSRDLDGILHPHCLGLGNAIGRFEQVGTNRYRDVFGVVWDRSADKDIGVVEKILLPDPTLEDYRFPDPLAPTNFDDIPGRIEAAPNLFRIYRIGFSLYERAWTLRGIENLMMDFYDHPEFVHALLDAIADYNIAQVRKAVTYDIDAVYFGDDWGQQHGLQMGAALWREFIHPRLVRMYGAVKKAGKYVFIHSCGDVDELFDELIGIGLDCFNPFQPEVMDVNALLPQYRGRLTFHGGLSTQQTLPFGTTDQVRNECRHLLELGAAGSYVFAPAHAVEGDVPLENLLAVIEEAAAQPGFRNVNGVNERTRGVRQ